MNGRPTSQEDRLRLNMEWMDYLLVDQYGWTLQEVHNLTRSDARQALSWAIAMSRQPPKADTGEMVYLGYDRIPPLRGEDRW